MTELQYSQSVKLAGASAAGVEQQFVEARSSSPVGSESGLVTRNIPSGEQSVRIAGYDLPEATVPLAPELDMTGRIKTAESYEIIGSQWNYGKIPLTWGETITGTGAITGPTTQTSSTYLQATTGTASGDSVLFQTKRHFRYQVFRTHAVSWAIVFGAHQTNVRKEIGHATPNNGWLVEQSGGTYHFVVRSNVGVVSGTNETKVARADWNIDKLDGTGPSGINIDLGKGVSFVIEFVWHGTQGLRYGINFFDRIIWCHEIKYSGVLSQPFSRNAILPLFTRMTNTGAVSAPGGSMQIGPVSYNVYGGLATGDAYVFAGGNRTTAKSVTSNTDPTYLAAVRPKATIAGAINRANITPLTFELFSSAEIFYEIFCDAIIAAGTWAETDYRSIAELSVNPSSVSDERIVDSGYISSASKGTGVILSGFAGDVFSSLDGSNNNTPLCFGVRVYKTGGNANAFCAIKWREEY